MSDQNPYQGPQGQNPYAGAPGQYPGQGQYPGGPPQQPPKKKLGIGKLLLIVGGIIVILFIGMIACTAVLIGTSSDDSDGSSSGGDSQSAPASDDLVPLGSEGRDGKFAFTVTNVETGRTEIGDPMFQEVAQGQFVIVSVDATNTGNEAQSFMAGAQKLTDEQGRTFNSNEMAGAAVSDFQGTTGIFDEINPGNTASFSVVFDIPVDATPVSVELHDSMFSNGVEMALR